MYDVSGRYAEVEFTDGSRGAYEVAQKYYRDFDRLRTESPEKFNKLCHSVFGAPRAWDAGDITALSGLGLAFTYVANQMQPSTAENEIKLFIKLAVKPSIPSAVSGAQADNNPAYELQSPFKHYDTDAPDIVPKHYQREVSFEWAGQDMKDCPGKYLITQSAKRAKAVQTFQP